MNFEHLPDFGPRLKRLRRLRGLKQQVVAEIAQVCQTTVSRWESGVLVPKARSGEHILRVLAASNGLATDSVLRRLVEDAQAAVHLVTDIDHRLLAASKPREKEWRRSVAELAGISLWQFASDRIEAAERGLADGDWWRQASVSPVVVDLEEAETGLRIAPGQMVWERLHLADGTPVRLCTSG